MLSVTSNALSSRTMEYPLIMFCSYVVRKEVEQHWKQKYDCRPISAYIQWYPRYSTNKWNGNAQDKFSYRIRKRQQAE